MKADHGFYESAGILAKNPLGIIALFIVMVYAVAGVVIGFAQPAFYESPYHPSVLFLTVFPIIVLIAFVYLVTKHHGKLYSPGDYDSSADFFRTLFVPEELKRRDTGVATSDPSTHVIPADARQGLDESYARWVKLGYSLLHQAEVLTPRVAPKSGRYRVRVWIEAIQDRPLDDIDSVTYRVWDDFRNRVLATSDKNSSFDLWLNVYGEFPVIALIKTKDGAEFQLQRYLDLPGRPQD